MAAPAATQKPQQHTPAVTWWPVILFLPARSLFALLVQLLATGIAALAGVADPWQAAAGWWMVDGSLADLFCLALLVWLTRREGLRLRDLFGASSLPLWRQLLPAPLFLLAILPGLLAGAGISWLFYGANNPPQTAIVHLPLWAALYATLVWPVLWAIVEEATYLGFLLPRLEVLSGRTSVAAVIVIVFWSCQHAFLPWLPDGTYLVSRILAAGCVAVAATLAFLIGGRRLVPLIGAHWFADAAAGFTAALLPILIAGR